MIERLLMNNANVIANKPIMRFELEDIVVKKRWLIF